MNNFYGKIINLVLTTNIQTLIRSVNHTELYQICPTVFQ